jgi:mono/diheme cytochrome c family protein
LRDFIRNAVVNEFGGREPSEQIVAALEAYVNDISFLPNQKLGGGGKLTAKSSEAARRGEAIFLRPFRNDASMSCAACHRPSTAFVDHGLHDVGTGGKFKTPTLVNANFSAPYFHDGRFETYEQVVDYFNRHFDLGYSQNERADLVAYLEAAGDADQPVTRNTVQAELDEIAMFAGVLDSAIASHNQEIIQLTVEAVGSEWRELGEQFPSPKDPNISEGLKERRHARNAVRELVLTLRRVAMAAEAGDFDDAQRAYAEYQKRAGAVRSTLDAAERFSLFNPQVRETRFKALDQLTRLAGGGLAQR